jgi:hypothetical protein
MTRRLELTCQTRKILGIIEVRNATHKIIEVQTFTQLIHRFIRRIKQILRKIDDLLDVRVFINAFDPCNDLHQWICSVLDMFKDLIHLPINFNKAIFVCIRKNNCILFLGGFS